jgi:hypothetical protein
MKPPKSSVSYIKRGKICLASLCVPFHFHFSPSFVRLVNVLKHFSVFSTLVTLKSLQPLHVSAKIGHPQVLILVSKEIAVSFQSCSFVPLFLVCA